MNERQQRFVKALAKFLVSNETEMSVKLQLQREEAKRWRDLRNETPLMGYYDGEEGLDQAVKELGEFLYGDTSKV